MEYSIAGASARVGMLIPAPCPQCVVYCQAYCVLRPQSYVFYLSIIWNENKKEQYSANSLTSSLKLITYLFIISCNNLFGTTNLATQHEGFSQS